MPAALSPDTPSLWETSEVTRAANAVGQLQRCQMSHHIRQQADSHRSGRPRSFDRNHAPRGNVGQNARRPTDAERRSLRYHAERGNDQRSINQDPAPSVTWGWCGYSPTGLNTTTANGGKSNASENAWPWLLTSSATTAPPLPMLEPAYTPASEFSSSAHFPLNGTPTR